MPSFMTHTRQSPHPHPSSCHNQYRRGGSEEGEEKGSKSAFPSPMTQTSLLVLTLLHHLNRYYTTHYHPPVIISTEEVEVKKERRKRKGLHSLHLQHSLLHTPCATHHSDSQQVLLQLLNGGVPVGQNTAQLVHSVPQLATLHQQTLHLGKSQGVLFCQLSS